MDDKTYKKYKKKAGFCPICGGNLALTKQELLE
jgi:rRNA maturation endonuclease Nob1